MLRRFARRLLPQTLNSVDAYALWAERYPAQAHNALMQAEQAAMLALLPNLSGRVVLDLACGTGRYGLIAQAAGARRVLGLDNSAAMLQRAEFAPLVLATTERIPLASASVDVILCGLALGHLPQLTLTMQEIGRVLRPGGSALISDFHPFLALNGAQRTFQAQDGQTYAVEHYPHLYADYHQTSSDADLRIEAVREPVLDAGTSPVVLVLHLLRI